MLTGRDGDLAHDAGSSTTDDAQTDGSDDGIGSECGPSAPVGPAVLRRLTRQEYRNTVRDLLGIDADDIELPPDERIGAFMTNASTPIDGLGVDVHARAAEELAARAVGQALPCDPAAVGESTCADLFIADLARRGFRREPSAEQLAGLREVFDTGRSTGTFDDGVQLVIEAVLQSPHFLYHVVSGAGAPGADGVIELTNDEVASRLSYFLWKSMPDSELFAAADAGALSDPRGLVAQAERMLEDPRSFEGIRSFHLQWLGADSSSLAYKDPEVYPQYDQALVDAMKDETARFANYVLRQGDGRLETLLRADFGFPSGPLWDLYGMSEPDGYDGESPVSMVEGQRGGLLMQASFLSSHAHANQSSPVERGVWIRKQLMCQDLPSPPPDVNTAAPEVSPDASTRERFEAHRENPACAACHNVIDGIGFALEHYDGVGAWRDVDMGRPVDASGWIVGSTDADGELDGAIELSERLAQSEQVQQCVVRQWFRFALGRSETSADECTLAGLDEEFQASGHDVPSLMLSIITSETFVRAHLE